MLSVLLMILKIIGWGLLILLGIILLLLILILFFPICYKANGSYEPPKEGGEQNVFCAKFSVRWFLPFSYLTGEYNHGLFYHAKFFGHILFTNYEEELKKKEYQAAKKEARKNAKREKIAVREQKLAKKEPENSFDVDEVAGDLKAYEAIDLSQQQNDLFTSKKRIKDGLSPKIHLLKKAKDFFHRLKCTFLSICDKIKEIFDSIEYYLDLWNKKSTQKEVQICKDRIIKLLKHIMPRKWRFYLRAGFEDPATTGKFMGFFGMLIAVFGNHICVVPDFENSVLEGNFNIKGRIRLLTVIMIALQFYFDKNLKRILEYAKKGGR